MGSQCNNGRVEFDSDERGYGEGGASQGRDSSLPGVSLISCVSNESREDGKQVESVRVVILESAFIAHGEDELGLCSSECMGGGTILMARLNAVYKGSRAQPMVGTLTAGQWLYIYCTIGVMS